MADTAHVPYRNWMRWIVFFLLLSVGLAFVSGFRYMVNDSSPIMFMLGLIIFQITIFVLPGLICGGLVVAITKRERAGAIVMILINLLLSGLYVMGMLLNAEK